MRIVHRCLVAFILVASAQSLAQAQPPPHHGGNFEWWHEFRRDFDMHRRRVNAWPHPFAIESRELVRSPYRTMVDNGWKMQNTLSDHLFAPEENELTYAGQLHLRWILTQVPPHRRQIYVMEAPTRDGTATRVASVYKYLGETAPAGPPCPVFVTRIAPRGGDGSYLADVDKMYKASSPTPRLPAAASDGGGSSESSDQP